MFSPGSMSSLPVEITTIMGWALTRRRAMPAPAAIATSGRTQPRAGRQQQRALAAIGAAAMHVLPRRNGLAADLGDIAVALHLLDGHHRVAAARQHRAGHDLDAARTIGQRVRRITRRLRARDAQPAGVFRGGRGAERDAIHRHAIERRLVALGVDVLAQHRAGGLRQRQRLDRQAHEVLLDEGFGLCWRQHD